MAETVAIWIGIATLVGVVIALALEFGAVELMYEDDREGLDPRDHLNQMRKEDGGDGPI